MVGLLRPRTHAALGHVGPALAQAAVIAHELSHLEARDPQLFTLALALLVFMPWNLPLWWQLRRLRYAIEIDCDAPVLKGGGGPAHYGETLIAGVNVNRRTSAAAACRNPSHFSKKGRTHDQKTLEVASSGRGHLSSFAIALTALAAQVMSIPTRKRPRR